jgi:hypothetical protein
LRESFALSRANLPTLYCTNRAAPRSQKNRDRPRTKRASVFAVREDFAQGGDENAMTARAPQSEPRIIFFAQ